MTGSAPAGWYPDPGGSERLRYFDGARWTDNFAPAPAAPQSQLQHHQRSARVVDAAERREAQRYGYTLEAWRAAKAKATSDAALASGYTKETWSAATEADRQAAVADCATQKRDEAAAKKQETEAEAAAARISFVDIAKARRAAKAKAAEHSTAPQSRPAQVVDTDTDAAERREAQRYGYTLEAWRTAKARAIEKTTWTPHSEAALASGYTKETWMAATEADRQAAVADYAAKKREEAAAERAAAAKRKAEYEAAAEAARQSRMDDASRETLAREVRAGDGLAYEMWFVAWAHVEGFQPARTAGNGADYGVDVVMTDAGTKVAVQCKNYSSPVGVSAVQEVMTGKAVYGCDGAWVVSTSEFTRQARALAKANGVKLRTLIPGNYIRGTGFTRP